MCNLAEVYQPKAGSRLTLYSETSPNTRINIAESNRDYKVIVGTHHRVVVTIFTLNGMRV